MGNKGAKQTKLSSKDVKILTKQTKMSKTQIQEFYDLFKKNNPDGLLNQAEFITLYCKLRSEPVDQIRQIAKSVFYAFDKDHNGSINFNEFLIAYVMTSSGDQRDKLEYAFDAYDADHSGTLDKKELALGIFGMLELLDADKKGVKAEELAHECMKQLDASQDGVLTKDEFINGLMKNYSLRMLMCPFN